MAVEPESDDLDKLLKKWSLWKATRIARWVTRFINNCRSQKKNLTVEDPEPQIEYKKTTGPLTMEKTDAQIEYWQQAGGQGKSTGWG